MTDLSNNSNEINNAKEEIDSKDSKQPKWYVVHTYTGYENRVKDKIQMMIDNEQNPDIIDVTVPEEEYVEVKMNQKNLRLENYFQAM